MDTTQFNKNNNFNIEKCLLLPYIITIANGQKEKLLKGVFNFSFYPNLSERKGVIVFNNEDENNLIIHTSVSLCLKFSDMGFLEDNFKDNEFDEIKEDWKQYIDKSFDFLLTARDKEFPLHEVKKLETISMSNFAFENMETLYKNTDLNATQLIKKFQFFTEKARFFYSSNPEFGLKYNWDINSVA